MTPISSDPPASEDRAQLLGLLRSCVQRGTVTLSSGRTTDFYLDGRLITLDPRGLSLVGRLGFATLRGQVEVVGGPAAAAIPIVAAIGLRSLDVGEPLSLFFTRDERKSHGMGRQIEGPAIEKGARVAIVDDVATSGGSIKRSAAAVEAEIGVSPRIALVLVDRTEGAREALADAGIELRALFTRADVEA